MLLLPQYQLQKTATGTQGRSFRLKKNHDQAGATMCHSKLVSHPGTRCQSQQYCILLSRDAIFHPQKPNFVWYSLWISPNHIVYTTLSLSEVSKPIKLSKQRGNRPYDLANILRLTHALCVMQTVNSVAMIDVKLHK